MASRIALAHGEVYLQHCIKRYIYHDFITTYPEFKDHILYKERPATESDYHVLEGLECPFVEQFEFNASGCRRVACYPFKAGLEPCTPEDDAQWTRIGYNWYLACQRACSTFRTLPLDAQWIDGRCTLINLEKKKFAAVPTKVMEMRTMYSGGINFVKGKLELNDEYCHTYGLTWKDGDCVPGKGQEALEFVTGYSLFRQPLAAMYADRYKNRKWPDPPPVPEWSKRPPVRARRSLAAKKDEHVSDLQTAVEIAAEMAAEFAIEVTAENVRKYLMKKAPQIAFRQSASLIRRLAMKRAVSMMLSQIIRVGASVAMRATAAAIGAATVVFAVVSVASMVMDSLDVFGLQKMITAKGLRELEHKYDADFFGSLSNHTVLVTPELVYYQNKTNLSETFNFGIVRQSEYLEKWIETETAVTERPPEIPKERAQYNVHGIAHGAGMFVFIVICVLFLEHVHYWVCCAFFFMVWLV